MAQNVAIVNGKPVPKARVDALIKPQLRGQPAARSRPNAKPAARRQVVMREIFTQEAEKQGSPASADYKAQLELARQTVLIGHAVPELRKTHPVTDADAQAEYDKFKAAANRARNTTPATSWSTAKTTPRS